MMWQKIVYIHNNPARHHGFAARFKAAIPVAWTFMSEAFASNVALSSDGQSTVTSAGTVFRGHATDMNVHPIFGPPVSAHKTRLNDNNF
jgi:hypothetical protein